MAFRYVVTSVLGSTPLGELELSDVAFNDPVAGLGGAFKGQAEITNTQPRDKLRTLTEPDAIALYVLDDETGNYLFGGPILARPWNRDSRRLEIQAQSWKAWTYQCLCRMNISTNPVSEYTFSLTGQDQFVIARALINAFCNGQLGCPTVVVGTELSGVNRDLNFHGSDQKFLGDRIDSMSNRDNGFEWTIETRPDNSGNPSLRFVPVFPSRGGINNAVLIIHQLETGGNILEMSNPQDSSANRRSRIWATGAGQPPDQPVAYDQDPGLSGGFILLREEVKNYNSVALITTLADHARAERNYRAQNMQTVQIGVALDDPDFRVYASGDKIRLKVEDIWQDWDFESVRVIDRIFKLNPSGDNPKPDMVTLTIDLNDTKLPEETAVL